MSYEFQHGLPVQSYRLGVGLLIVNKKGQIWMAQRRKAHNNTLQMPQGGIDERVQDNIYYWETPFEAAKRELYEETGLYTNLQWLNVSSWLTYSFPMYAARKSYNGQFIGQKQKWFLVNFYGSDKDVKIGNEFSRWTWIPRHLVINSTLSFKQGLYRKVLTLLMCNRSNV